jgi:ABC-type transport system involved in multi-copper enzyme maturation permease subunit
MARRSIFWRFVKDEFIRLVKGTDFLGFLGISALMLPFSFVTTHGSSNPVYEQTMSVFGLEGLIAGVFFAYLVSKGFAKEFEKRTLNILLTTPLSRNKIFIGKLLSFLLLVPILMLVVGTGLVIIYAADGMLPTIQLVLTSYLFLLLALFLVSIIAFSMVISILLKKTGTMIIVMAIYIFIPMTLAGAIGVTWENGETRVNYPINFLLPGSLYALGISVLWQELAPNWIFIMSQFGFLTIFILLGLVLFRRAQIWG